MKDSTRVDKKAFVYQIYYDDKTRASLDRGFMAIESDIEEGSDWFEYKCIFKALDARGYGDSDLIGVLSPRFFEKTGHTSGDVFGLLNSRSSTIYNFSPAFDISALYLSPWHHGERVHEGLMRSFNQVVRRLGFDFDMKSVVLDSNMTIFSNYFIAPYYIWREWQRVVQEIMAYCDGSSELSKGLNEFTRHRGEHLKYRMRIFVLERLISFLVMAQGWRSLYVYEPRRYPYSITGISRFSSMIISCDILKQKYLLSRDAYFLESWSQLVNWIAKARFQARRSPGN